MTLDKLGVRHVNLGKGIYGILINDTVPNVALREKESPNNGK